MSDSPSFWQISLTLPPDMYDLPDEVLYMFEEALSVSHQLADAGDPASYELLYQGDLDEAEKAAILGTVTALVPETIKITTQELAPQNWLETVYETFPPLHIGRYLVHGTHVEPPLEAGQQRLVIVAATAFGTGQHGTTWGCLMAFDDLLQAGFLPKNCADIGTGSGILALAAHGTLNCPTLATDNDPESIRLTEIHAGMNNAGVNFQTHLAEGVDTHIRTEGPFDLVFANILAGPLKELAPDLAAITSATGRLILSGLLETQAEAVAACYYAQNMQLVATRARDGWATLVFAH